MSRDKQMVNDLIEIFDEEYNKRNLITPQNTAEKMTAKGYRKTADVAREVFAEIDKLTVRYINNADYTIGNMILDIIELKKKYESEGAE